MKEFLFFLFLFCSFSKLDASSTPIGDFPAFNENHFILFPRNEIPKLKFKCLMYALRFPVKIPFLADTIEVKSGNLSITTLSVIILHALYINDPIFFIKELNKAMKQNLYFEKFMIVNEIKIGDFLTISLKDYLTTHGLFYFLRRRMNKENPLIFAILTAVDNNSTIVYPFKGESIIRFNRAILEYDLDNDPHRELVYRELLCYFLGKMNVKSNFFMLNHESNNYLRGFLDKYSKISLRNWFKGKVIAILQEFIYSEKELIFAEEFFTHILDPKCYDTISFLSDPSSLSVLTFMINMTTFKQEKVAFFINLLIDKGIFYLIANFFNNKQVRWIGGLLATRYSSLSDGLVFEDFLESLQAFKGLSDIEPLSIILIHGLLGLKASEKQISWLLKQSEFVKQSIEAWQITIIGHKSNFVRADSAKAMLECFEELHLTLKGRVYKVLAKLAYQSFLQNISLKELFQEEFFHPDNYYLKEFLDIHGSKKEPSINGLSMNELIDSETIFEFGFKLADFPDHTWVLNFIKEYDYNLQLLLIDTWIAKDLWYEKETRESVLKVLTIVSDSFVRKWNPKMDDAEYIFLLKKSVRSHALQLMNVTRRLDAEFVLRPRCPQEVHLALFHMTFEDADLSLFLFADVILVCAMTGKNPNNVYNHWYDVSRLWVDAQNKVLGIELLSPTYYHFFEKFIEMPSGNSKIPLILGYLEKLAVSNYREHSYKIVKFFKCLPHLRVLESNQWEEIASLLFSNVLNLGHKNSVSLIRHLAQLKNWQLAYLGYVIDNEPLSANTAKVTNILSTIDQSIAKYKTWFSSSDFSYESGMNPVFIQELGGLKFFKVELEFALALITYFLNPQKDELIQRIFSLEREPDGELIGNISKTKLANCTSFEESLGAGGLYQIFIRNSSSSLIKNLLSSIRFQLKYCTRAFRFLIHLHYLDGYHFSNEPVDESIFAFLLNTWMGKSVDYDYIRQLLGMDHYNLKVLDLWQSRLVGLTSAPSRYSSKNVQSILSALSELSNFQK
jgi:hypothetical protein